MRLDAVDRLADEALEERRVLAVDGDHGRLVRGDESLHEFARDDERLLVGERDLLPRPDRRDRRPQPGEPDDGRHDDIDALRCRRRLQPFGTDEYPGVEPVERRRGASLPAPRRRSRRTPGGTPAPAPPAASTFACGREGDDAEPLGEERGRSPASASRSSPWSRGWRARAARRRGSGSGGRGEGAWRGVRRKAGAVVTSGARSSPPKQQPAKLTR